MTREEAAKKLMRMGHYNKGSSIDWFLESLEILGLIKFEEPEKNIRSPSAVISDTLEIKFTLADKCIHALMAEGYRIVRADWLDRITKS